MTLDARQSAPATQRNREPILSVLHQVLPPNGTVLEISSGTGEHAVFFAPRLAPRLWLPSDLNPQALASITAWRQQMPTATLCPPIALDVRDPVWAVEQTPLPDELQALHLKQNPIRAIVNINMIHIAPWSATIGLMTGASRLLPGSGILYLYGPYRQGGKHTASSNAAFDQSLQRQNPEWGVRDLEAVVAAAAAAGLSFVRTWEMPANNLSVVFQKA